MASLPAIGVAAAVLEPHEPQFQSLDLTHSRPLASKWLPMKPRMKVESWKSSTAPTSCASSPSGESCLRLVRAPAAETHENWLGGMRYLNMEHLAEHRKEQSRLLEEAA